MAALQGLPDLASLEGLSPYLNQAGMQQIQQAQQFNNVGLQQNQADLQAKTLANLFSEQNNPQLIQAQGLANTNQGYLNDMNRVKSAQAVQLAPEAMEAERSSLLSKASEAQLNDYLQKAQQDLVSGDPQRAAKGRAVMDASWTEITRRAKEESDQKLHKMDNDSAERRTSMSAGATIKAAQIGADSRLSVAQQKAQAVARDKSVLEITKGDPTKMAGYYAKMAMETDDPDEKNRYLTSAAQMERLAQTTTGAVAGQGGKLDVPAMTGTAPTATPSAFSNVPAGANTAPKINMPPPVAGKVRVLMPNGKTGYVPAEQADEAKKRGAQILN